MRSWDVTQGPCTDAHITEIHQKFENFSLVTVFVPHLTIAVRALRRDVAPHIHIHHSAVHSVVGRGHPQQAVTETNFDKLVSLIEHRGSAQKFYKVVLRHSG